MPTVIFGNVRSDHSGRAYPVWRPTPDLPVDPIMAVAQIVFLSLVSDITFKVERQRFTRRPFRDSKANDPCIKEDGINHYGEIPSGYLLTRIICDEQNIELAAWKALAYASACRGASGASCAAASNSLFASA